MESEVVLRPRKIIFCQTVHSRLMFEGVASGTVNLTSSVPPGCVLGPILFLIYINDLPESLTSKVGFFADNAIVYKEIYSADGCQILQNDFAELTSWKDLWPMNFNRVSVRFWQSPAKDYQLYSIIHAWPNSQQSKIYQIFGSSIISDLNWNKHMNQVTGKANRSWASWNAVSKHGHNIWRQKLTKL